MTVNLVPQLAEALQRGNLALFLGADLPSDLTGRPSRADLAAKLAQRLSLSGPPPTWPEVAAQYEASAGRNALIRWLRDQLDGCQPGPVCGLLAQLPVAVYLTTAYDPWLYEALRTAGRGPNLAVVDPSSLGLRDPNRPTIAHLLGVYDRPESLALTAADLNQLPESKRQILAGLVHPTLANQSVLLLGQDLRDSHFQTLYQHALFQAGTIRPPAFAVWEGLAEWEKQTWLRQEVRVIETPVLELLQALLAGGEGVELPRTEPVAVQVTPSKPTPLVEIAQPAPRRYHDLELLVGDPTDDGYPVHVLASPAGEGESVFVTPFDEAELAAALARLESGTSDEAFLTDLGTRLFRALFSGDVRARYAESTGATTADAGLRLRLRLDPPALHALPWELLRDPEKREFLVLSKRALVTRYLHVPRPTPPLAVEPPLRVLLALAAPKDEPPLDLEAEAEHVRQALRPLLDAGQVMLAVEPHVTKRRLRERLLDADPHVLHFVGYGGLARDRGVLLLEDGEGNADPLDGPTLGTLLKGGSVRLALLNACLSAREAVPDAGQRAAFLGVGPALVDAGLGAVVAMQFSIPDTSARLFAEDFYALLARFLPVDECVSRAREALLLEVGLDRADWATPVLFMRAPDGVLWKHERRVKAEVTDLQGTKQSVTVPTTPPERTDRPACPVNSKPGQDTESVSKKEQEELARTRLRQEISKNLRELDPLRSLAAHIKSLQKQPPSQLTAELVQDWLAQETEEALRVLVKRQLVRPDHGVRDRLEGQFELFARIVNKDEIEYLEAFYNGMNHVRELEASFREYLEGWVTGLERDERLGELLRETLKIYDLGINLQKSFSRLNSGQE